MLKRIALVGGALSVLVGAGGAGCCMPNCCWTNTAISALSLLRDLFNYQIAI